MIKKSLAMFIIFLLIFNVSCKKMNSSNNIEDEYINEIEKEYQNSSDNDVVAETNDNIITTDTNGNINEKYSDAEQVIKDQAESNIQSNILYSTNNITEKYNNTQLDKNQSESSAQITVKKGPIKATIDNFYSPWTSKNDPLIIREIRVMIANKEYTKALNYINNLDFNNLPADADVGHLYQFKGIIHFFLSKRNKSHIALADESFKNAARNTKIEKFKPLSLLWNGMLYQAYSTDENQLKEAIALFDKVITEYPRTRFANDAVFYKAAAMKKLGMNENEYNDLFLSIKRGGFVDTLVFSQIINDYVPANDLVDREILK